MKSGENVFLLHEMKTMSSLPDNWYLLNSGKISWSVQQIAFFELYKYIKTLKSTLAKNKLILNYYILFSKVFMDLLAKNNEKSLY